MIVFIPKLFSAFFAYFFSFFLLITNCFRANPDLPAATRYNIQYTIYINNIDYKLIQRI